MAGLSLHAWSIALTALGVQVARWSEPRSPCRLLPPLLAEYVSFRHVHANAADSSLKREVREITAWLEHLRSRGRSWRTVQLSAILIRKQAAFERFLTANPQLKGSVISLTYPGDHCLRSRTSWGAG